MLAGISRPEGTKPYEGDQAELVAEGEKLWNDTSLSTNGLSCATCHAGYNTLSESFAKPYPHTISMVTNQVGKEIEVSAEQIVQFCMVSPMANDPLPWESRELAALTAYVLEYQKGYKPK